MNEKAVSDIEEALAGVEEAPEGWESVELGLPSEFEERVAANERLILSRDAYALTLHIPANRGLNPDLAKTQQLQVNAKLMTIARIDRLFPGAKAAARRMASAAAKREQDAEKA